jgi:hypothetical protein
MSILSRVKEWVTAEVLTATDLNGEFDNIINNILAGTTATVGMVQLEDSHSSTSTTKAACPKNVKEAYDLAAAGGGGNSYYPDHNEVDQGLTGNGKSAKAYIDTIVADNATLVFQHNSGGATTTYIFSTNETIPSNINIVIEKGAILSISNTKTLTINGPFEAGFYQVFNGAGYALPMKKKSNILWWGVIEGSDASVGQIASNTTAIQKAIDSAIKAAGSLYVPRGNYLHNGGLSIDHLQDTFNYADFQTHPNTCHGFKMSGESSHSTVFYNMSTTGADHLRVGRYDSSNDVAHWQELHNGTTMVANGIPPIGIMIEEISLCGDEDSGNGLVAYIPIRSRFRNIFAAGGKEKTNFWFHCPLNCKFDNLKISLGNQYLAKFDYPASLTQSVDAKYGLRISTIRTYLTNVGGDTFKHSSANETSIDYIFDDSGINRNNINAEAASIYIESADPATYPGESISTRLRAMEINGGMVQIKYGYGILLRRVDTILISNLASEQYNPTQNSRCVVRLEDTKNITIDKFDESSGAYIELDNALYTSIVNSNLFAIKIYDIATAHTLTLKNNYISKAYGIGVEGAAIAAIGQYYEISPQNFTPTNEIIGDHNGSLINSYNNQNGNTDAHWHFPTLGANDYFRPITSGYSLSDIGYGSAIQFLRAGAQTAVNMYTPITAGEYYCLSFYFYIGTNSNGDLSVIPVDTSFAGINFGNNLRCLQVMPYIKQCHYFGAQNIGVQLSYATPGTWYLARTVFKAPANSAYLRIRLMEGKTGADANTYSLITGVTLKKGINIQLMSPDVTNYQDKYQETVTIASPNLFRNGISLLDSNTNAITAVLGSGNYIGQIKTIIMTDATNSSTVSVDSHETSDPEIGTFNAVDETWVLMWTGTEWVTIKATCTFV